MERTAPLLPHQWLSTIAVKNLDPIAILLPTFQYPLCVRSGHVHWANLGYPSPREAKSVRRRRYAERSRRLSGYPASTPSNALRD